MTKPITKAIVPAAGLGTRLLPATKSQPKEMLPVGRKPAVQYVVEELQAAKLYATIEPLGHYVQHLPFILGFTGVQHASGAVHKPIRERRLEGELEVVKAYERITELARMGKKALLNEDWATLGQLMNENHAIQRDLGGFGPENERLIAAALDAGAPGAKLVGAGDGGTIIALWPYEDATPLEKALKAAGATAIYRLKVVPGVTVEKELSQDQMEV